MREARRGTLEADRSGPETYHDEPGEMTLAERFISAFRLPYVLGCFLFGFVVFGFLNSLLAKYVESASLPMALQTASSWQYLAEDALFAYSFYAPRYMRTKLWETAHSVEALLPDGRLGFRQAFAGISSARPQVGTWVIFLGGLLLATNVPAILGGPSTIVFNLDPTFSPLEFFSSIFQIVSLALVTLALSSVVWTYYSITRGIRRFSSAPLQLRPYYEDSFLGLKPIGSLALSLATVYFGLIALFLLSLLTAPSVPSTADIVGVGSFLFGLIIVGVLNFFTPLRTLHRRMIAEKRAARIAFGPKLQTVFEDSSDPRPADDMAHIFRVDMMDRKLASMAVWPYDIGILGRLSVIAASVTAILISRILALIFHI